MSDELHQEVPWTKIPENQPSQLKVSICYYDGTVRDSNVVGAFRWIRDHRDVAHLELLTRLTVDYVSTQVIVRLPGVSSIMIPDDRMGDETLPYLKWILATNPAGGVPDSEEEDSEESEAQDTGERPGATFPPTHESFIEGAGRSTAPNEHVDPVQPPDNLPS